MTVVNAALAVRAHRPRFRLLVSALGVLLLASSTLGGVSAEERANLSEWTEVRRVAVAVNIAVPIELDDDYRVVSDPDGVVHKTFGRRLELMSTRPKISRVMLERAQQGPLEILVAPVGSAASSPAPASSLSPSAAAQAAASRERENAATANRVPAPATSGSSSLPVPAVDPSYTSGSAVSSPAVSPQPASSLATSAPAVFLTSILAPFRPAPPMAFLPPSAPAPGRSAVGAIVAPPRPLVLTTPPAADLVFPQPSRLPPGGSLVPVMDAIETTNGELSSTAVPPTTASSGGPVAFELPVVRGSNRPQDTSLISGITTKPGELAIFTLATDLEARGLWGDAVQQYRRLLNDFPATQLKEAALLHIGHSFKERAASMEEEAVRQFDLRRSGTANEAVDQAIGDYASAITAYRDLIRSFPQTIDRNHVQLRIAQSLHGLVRARFQKGAIPQDSPAVVVEYLRAFVGTDDTELLAPARLGIAQYFRDLADARMLTRQDRLDIRRAYERSISEYRALIDSSPYSPSAEEALIDVARLYDRNLEMRRFDQAVTYYNELLRRFPNSVYADEARARARWLRENYL